MWKASFKKFFVCGHKWRKDEEIVSHLILIFVTEELLPTGLACCLEV